MRVGIDFDDVIYPFHAHLKELIRRRYGVDLRVQRLTTFFYELHPALRALGVDRQDVWSLVQETWHDNGGHRDQKPIDPGIATAIDRIGKENEVVLVSARDTASRPNVERFLDRHGIRVDSIRLDRFEKVGFDVLVDDFPKHAVENARAGGWSLLFDRDENSTFDETREPRLLRVASWVAIERAIGRISGRMDDA